MPISREEANKQAWEYGLEKLVRSVEMNPHRRDGVPVLHGTRFTVAQVLGELADGRRVAEIAFDFDLPREHIEDILIGLAHLFSAYDDNPLATILARSK